jgi:hypothetical protein
MARRAHGCRRRRPGDRCAGIGVGLARRRPCAPRLFGERGHVRRRSASRGRHRSRKRRRRSCAGLRRDHVRRIHPRQRTHRHDRERRLQGHAHTSRCLACPPWPAGRGGRRRRRSGAFRRSGARGPVRPSGCARRQRRGVRRPPPAPSASWRDARPSPGARGAARTGPRARRTSRCRDARTRAHRARSCAPGSDDRARGHVARTRGRRG